jgi:CYTH domain-containing protein
MSHSAQIELPFPSLDFSGRAVVMLGEIERKLVVSVDHLANQVTDGSLVALDLKSKGKSRRLIRVPIEEYRRYVMARLTGEGRKEFIAGLPAETLREILKEVQAALKHAA